MPRPCFQVSLSTDKYRLLFFRLHSPSFGLLLKITASRRLAGGEASFWLFCSVVDSGLVCEGVSFRTERVAVKENESRGPGL